MNNVTIACLACGKRYRSSSLATAKMAYDGRCPSCEAEDKLIEVPPEPPMYDLGVEKGLRRLTPDEIEEMEAFAVEGYYEDRAKVGMAFLLGAFVGVFAGVMTCLFVWSLR